MIVAFIITFTITFILNMICAIGLKSIAKESILRSPTGESSIPWLNTKLIRILLLIPPISIVVLLVAWVVVIVASIVGQLKDYLN